MSERMEHALALKRATNSFRGALMAARGLNRDGERVHDIDKRHADLSIHGDVELRLVHGYYGDSSVSGPHFTTKKPEGDKRVPVETTVMLDVLREMGWVVADRMLAKLEKLTSDALIEAEGEAQAVLDALATERARP